MKILLCIRKSLQVITMLIIFYKCVPLPNYNSYILDPWHAIIYVNWAMHCNSKKLISYMHIFRYSSVTVLSPDNHYCIMYAAEISRGISLTLGSYNILQVQVELIVAQFPLPTAVMFNSLLIILSIG